MKLLHILKSAPDDVTKALIEILSQGQDATLFPLYESEVDYEQLLTAVFDHHKIITWW